MMYCYHCTARLSRQFDVCPHCNKTLDIDTLKTLYDTDSGRDVKRIARLRIWLKEHQRNLLPILTCAGGILLGIVFWWGKAEIRVARQTVQYQGEIATLTSRIAEMESDNQDNLAGLQSQVQGKDSLITCLESQKETLASLIDFTRRLARSAEITPQSQEEADFYRRNSLYLIHEFNKQQEALIALGYGSAKDLNLETIPQLLSAQTAELAPERL